MKPMTEAHFQTFRRHMVEVIDLHFDLAEEEIGRSRLSPALRDALLEVPRHAFVPAQLVVAAYQDTPLPIGFDKTISQPFIAALMIELLDVRPGQKVLEVGTGLGYQAAILAQMGSLVHSVEIVEEFAEAARLRLAAHDHDVEIRVGDGTRGWKDFAPFDRILITAACAEVPPALLDQLGPGGTIVAPLGAGDVQQLSRVTLGAAGEVRVEPCLPVRFTRLETS